MDMVEEGAAAMEVVEEEEDTAEEEVRLMPTQTSSYTPLSVATHKDNICLEILSYSRQNLHFSYLI